MGQLNLVQRMFALEEQLKQLELLKNKVEKGEREKELMGQIAQLEARIRKMELLQEEAVRLREEKRCAKKEKLERQQKEQEEKEQQHQQELRNWFWLETLINITSPFS